MRHVRRVVLVCLVTAEVVTSLAIATASASAASSVLLGDQSVESGSDSASSGVADAFSFAAGLDGTATSISVYLDAQNRATTLRVGLYSDDNGDPGHVAGVRFDQLAGCGRVERVNDRSH